MNPIIFNPFPELTTERLVLRRIEKADAPEVFFLRSDNAVMQYLAKDKEKSVETTIGFIELINGNAERNEAIVWGIACKERVDHLVGYICLWHIQPENSRCEIGYVLHPDHWGKGIMKEAIFKVLEFGKETLGLHSVEAHIDPGNAPSAGILEATGFVREAYFRENFFYNGRFLDSAIYSKIL